jgi:hypothetical protein
MKVIVLSCAENEFADVVDYYNTQCSGLGYEFAAEVQRTFDRINHFPEAWPLFSLRSRRCLIDPLPLCCSLSNSNRLHLCRWYYASETKSLYLARSG